MITKPSVYRIEAELSFVDAFARGVLKRFGADPALLSSVTILLPNRRAVRALRDSFLRLRGENPLLLPAMRAIGDVDEAELELTSTGFGLDLSTLVRPISPIERQVLLSQLVERWQLPSPGQDRLAPAQAWRLAQELATFIDHVHTAGASFENLGDLAPEDLAEHWSETLEFLKIVTEHWPEILDSLGVQDPASFRNQTLKALTDFYLETRPKSPVIAAGSTGSVPATAQLLKTISCLPNGHVVLPGLDTDLSEEIWESLDETHPQNGLKRLLFGMGVSRFEVEDWVETSELSVSGQRERSQLLRTALLPAQHTTKWLDSGVSKASASELFHGLSCIVAPSRREEATAVALALREVLETPGKTAALVTPDRQLALHVRAALRRWGINIDDSGGDQAINSQPGKLLSLIAAAASDRFGPLSFLALLQHPLAAMRKTRSEYLSLVRHLDKTVMRGVRPAGGLDGVLRRAEAVLKQGGSERDKESLSLLREVASELRPLECLLEEPVGLNTLLVKHIEIAEALCTAPGQSGAEILWRGEAGTALSEYVSSLLEYAAPLEVPTAESYEAFFAEIMKSVIVRPNWNKHPRLQIWGPLEARLQHTDLMIISGLNEGVWPAESKTDPWMNRSMREEFGLPPIERRIGQSAHDFVTAASASEVLLTRSEKTDGTPTVPSRWWFRIEACAASKIPSASRYLDWVGSLDEAPLIPGLAPPTPTPPISARPQKLSVTQVQEWMRDPYALYAKKILGLAPLDPIDDKPNAAQKGTLLHEALERFLKEPGPRSGREGLERLTLIGRQVFEPVFTQPAVYAFWWPRFERIANWFVEHELHHAKDFETVLVEGWAKKTVSYGAEVPAFTLIAKADRIDRRRSNGAYLIIDYKTGVIPTAKQVEAGFAPQLPLEAWLAKQGAFDGLDAGQVEDLIFWKLTGGEPVQEQKRPVKDVGEAVLKAEQGLEALVTAFSKPDTPYLSNPRPTITGYGDYDHLARVKEWQHGAREAGTEPEDKL